MNQPLVSVIIPTYNCAKYIHQTLQCLMDQTHKAVEVIVVDDGSTDQTPELVRAFGQGVRLIEQRNAGVCAARNEGFRAASGDFLCFMDHDDYWYPEKLSWQLRCFSEFPESGLVYSDFTNWTTGSDGHFPQPSQMRGNSNYRIDKAFSGWIYHQLMLDCWVLTSSAMIRRSLLQTAGLFDENLPYSEDWDLWLRMARHAPFTKIASSLTLYRQHPQQGHKTNRYIDYRTRLLESNFHKHGLTSPDGSSISQARFQRQLGRYHYDFGRYQSQQGQHKLALASFHKARRNGFHGFRFYGWTLRSLVMQALAPRKDQRELEA